MKSNIHKKMTHEDKFERKWWVDNRAKRVWVRFEKRANRRKFRRKVEIKQIVTNPADLASAINEIGYRNVLNIIPCNCYDGCIIVVLYRKWEDKNE